jgi:hypothetical protein
MKEIFKNMMTPQISLFLCFNEFRLLQFLVYEAAAEAEAEIRKRENVKCKNVKMLKR